MSGGMFERELKGILRGDEGVLESVTRSCSPEERAGYTSIATRPFTVLRAAGSLGVDLVAIRGDVSFPIEVKSSRHPTLWLSNTKRTIDQAIQLREECARTGLLPLYAYRRKHQRGDSWRLFTIEDVTVQGALRRVQAHVPKVTTSKEGHYILRWEDGEPLHAFLRFVSNGMAPEPVPKA